MSDNSGILLHSSPDSQCVSSLEMDGKEIKAALKTAREAIRKKDYVEALKHCKVTGHFM